MNCKHHPDYDPASGEPTETIWVDWKGSLKAPCPHCWQAFGRLGWARLDHVGDEYKRTLKRITELEQDGKRLDWLFEKPARLAALEAVWLEPISKDLPYRFRAAIDKAMEGE